MYVSHIFTLHISTISTNVMLVWIYNKHFHTTYCASQCLDHLYIFDNFKPPSSKVISWLVVKWCNVFSYVRWRWSSTSWRLGWQLAELTSQLPTCTYYGKQIHILVNPKMFCARMYFVLKFVDDNRVTYPQRHSLSVYGLFIMVPVHMVPPPPWTRIKSL